MPKCFTVNFVEKLGLPAKRVGGNSDCCFSYNGSDLVCILVSLDLSAT